MNNDYLFKALLQRNNRVLTGLICSLLHLDVRRVRSVEILNPIVIGTYVEDKDFILDVKVLMNNDTVIDLEMQVINEHDWIERSLSYLCRSYDHLKHGDHYIDVKTAIQISFLDFTLFPENPEFYAVYQLRSEKNTIYSDKLRLHVVNLKQINLATEEDKRYHIDQWAALFKATTWEEIKMLARQNEYIRDASETIYRLSQEEKLRMQCEAREDYYRRQRKIEKRLAEQEETIEQQKEQLEKRDETIGQQEETISRQEEQLSEKETFIKQQAVLLEEKTRELERLRLEMSQYRK
ncbi:MAG: Rpn family recombination-promoting nuclease/putative transposase [Candidatus Gastranaerophilales bacterium]|nr:Rpn family recombination-promoting nuclease/putative transposase [Candidatus Gastranaerophilales bacterium]